MVVAMGPWPQNKETVLMVHPPKTWVMEGVVTEVEGAVAEVGGAVAEVEAPPTEDPHLES